jgi:hypothetical protein
MSTSSTDAGPSSSHENGSSALKVKASGAAALKPTEVAVENLVGKKRSKFWVYAIEPVATPEDHQPSNDNAMVVDEPSTNGKPSTPPHSNGVKINSSVPLTPPHTAQRDRSMEGSLSPLSP